MRSQLFYYVRVGLDVRTVEAYQIRLISTSGVGQSLCVVPAAVKFHCPTEANENQSSRITCC